MIDATHDDGEPDGEIEVSRQRAPFTMVRRAVLEDEDLGAAQKMVYVALCYFADNVTGTLKTHRKTIAEIASCGLRTLDAALKVLEERGYVSVTRRQSKGKYRLANIYALLNFWTDTEDRRGAGDAPPEQPENRRGATVALPRAGDAQSLNKTSLNKKEREGGTEVARLPVSRGNPEATRATAPLLDSHKPSGVLETMAQIAQEAGKPWTIYGEDRANISTAIAVHGGETVVNAWRSWLANGGSAKLRIFLEDAKYPKPEEKPAPPTTCEECGREVHGARYDMDGDQLCTECATIRRDQELTPDEIAEAKDFSKMGAAS
jgi:hypothetical protein